MKAQIPPVFQVALLALFALCVGAPAYAAVTYSWTGTSDALWSNLDNWDPVGVPASGDSVVFPFGVSNLVTTNDLPGLTLNRVVFNGGGYTVDGNGIAVTGSVGGSYGGVFNVPVDVAADGAELNSSTFNAAVNVAGNGVILSNSTFNAALNLSTHPVTMNYVWLTGASSALSGSGAITLGGGAKDLRDAQLQRDLPPRREWVASPRRCLTAWRHG